MNYISQKEYLFSAQRTINKLAGSLGVYGSCTEFDSMRYDHVNLDGSEDFHYSEYDIDSARIYPKRCDVAKTALSISINMDTLQAQIASVSSTFESVAKHVIKKSLRFFIKIDSYCEQICALVHKRVVSALKKAWNLYEAEAASLINENTRSPHSLKVAVTAEIAHPSKIHIHYLSVPKSKPLSYSIYNHAESYISEVETRKTKIFLQALHLVYQELVYGTQRRNIDRT